MKKSPLKLSFLLFALLAFACQPLQRGDGCPIGYIKAKAGNCVENLECLEKDKCIKQGKCTYANQMCVATNSRDCLRSENCSKLGECAFEPSRQGRTGLCVASETGCKQSEVCKKFGKCSPGPDRFCIVDSDEDCAESAICKNEGRCTAKRVERVDGRRSRLMACQR